ncbi:NusA-like transcription termination signal-binding factor [Methanosphaerula subterraneus]|jgi:N utilization substance protein A|uniref:NusA-like transcription termination signal-binding factor n=1 Tax=Methanosphaerula subterraneus TaxID=3350244 RepID=UPI003F85DAC1
MAEVLLTEDCMRLISQFESLTGAGSRDCVIDDRNERIIYVINPGEMGLAIGKKGASIKKASDVMGKRIEVVEYSDDPEQFIKNCFLPAQVVSVEFEESEEGPIAHVEVREEDRGIAIGKEGKNIFKAKRLSQRQHDIADVQLEQSETN